MIGMLAMVPWTVHLVPWSLAECFSRIEPYFWVILLYSVGHTAVHLVTFPGKYPIGWHLGVQSTAFKGWLVSCLSGRTLVACPVACCCACTGWV